MPDETIMASNTRAMRLGPKQGRNPGWVVKAITPGRFVMEPATPCSVKSLSLLERTYA